MGVYELARTEVVPLAASFSLYSKQAKAAAEAKAKEEERLLREAEEEAELRNYG